MVANWVLTLPWTQIEKASADFNIDSRLIGAIVQTESSGNAYATRYEDHWKYLLDVNQFAKSLGITTITEQIHQKTSWGLMQIMGSVLREKGFRYYLPYACQPEVNLHYGAMVIRDHLKGKSLNDAVACYNAGSVQKRQDGSYVNQIYVDKVLSKYQELLQ